MHVPNAIPINRFDALIFSGSWTWAPVRKALSIAIFLTCAYARVLFIIRGYLFVSRAHDEHKTSFHNLSSIHAVSFKKWLNSLAAESISNFFVLQRSNSVKLLKRIVWELLVDIIRWILSFFFSRISHFISNGRFAALFMSIVDSTWSTALGSVIRFSFEPIEWMKISQIMDGIRRWFYC